MTKEVIASVSGLQFVTTQDGGEAIETISPAEYYYRNDAHYLRYEEPDEDTGNITSNLVKYRDGVLEITRKGYVNVHMIFEKDKKNLTNYLTPFGAIMIGIDTSEILFEESEDCILLEVRYALDVNYERLADCILKIRITPKQNGIKLMQEDAK